MQDKSKKIIIFGPNRADKIRLLDNFIDQAGIWAIPSNTIVPISDSNVIVESSGRTFSLGNAGFDHRVNGAICVLNSSYHFDNLFAMIKKFRQVSAAPIIFIIFGPKESVRPNILPGKIYFYPSPESVSLNILNKCF